MNLLLSTVFAIPGPTLWWVAAGCMLVFALAFPDPAVPSMGVAAFLVGLLLANVSLPPLAQVIIWGMLAMFITLLLRWFLLPRQQRKFSPSSAEARTLTMIEAGRLGEVFFEGTSWSARCEVLRLGEVINPNQSVYVVGREGNTLVIVPGGYLDSN